jgi:hypothetical protein
VLTLQEALDSANEETWDWENKLVCNLQFRTQDLDMPNVQTLDSSKYGNHAQLGDGITAARYPTQLAGKMGFDGNDYLTLDGLLSLHTQTTGTFIIAARLTQTPGVAAYFLGGRDGATTTRMYIYTTATRDLRTTWGAISQNFLGVDLGLVWHTIGVRWTGGFFEVFLDGVSLAAAVAYVTAAGTGDEWLKLGREYTGAANGIAAEYAGTMYSTDALTDVQLLDAHNGVMASLGSQL